MTRVLITGGLGFIGSNLGHRLLGEGQEVTILDNLSRPGSQHNLAWLRATRHPGHLSLIRADVRDVNALHQAVLGVERIYHLAGQVAVTTSLEDPRGDFEANALGSFNLLEALRAVGGHPTFIYSSTNKVYGPLEGTPVVEEVNRYRFADFPYGKSEQQPLDFHRPYGCSKGAADQYVRDYCRVYGKERLPRLQDGFIVEKEGFWVKDSENRWRDCDRDTALRFEASAGSWNPLQNAYALGCLVLRKPV